MKASQFHFATLKDAPADAEIVSHQLMMRAGMIKKLGAGIYSYMPLGLRVIRKVEAIIREEMNRAGAIELIMPVVQPAELWQETGRFEKMGPELLRIQDRHGRDFVVQPTSEEVITDIARQDLRSYKQLPKNFYQIQTKFRDERRPRFGLMRGREFVMKDAYSFDRSPDDAKASYRVMAAAYRRIFDRFGLRYRAVAADSGAIGGDLSEEFQVIAATGEDAIIYCANTDYAANIEKAHALAPAHARATPQHPLTQVATEDASACDEVASKLGLPLTQVVKSMVVASDTHDATGAVTKTKLHLLLLRGDHEMNEVKVAKLAGMANFRLASGTEIENVFACPAGCLGPVNAPQLLSVIADIEVALMSDWVCGANQIGMHYTGVNWERDLPLPEQIADIRNVVEGDLSPCGKGVLSIERGIEIGHIFYLGQKYSQAMNATFLDTDGKPKYFEMGCYGVGVTRLPAAAIEQNHDARGMIWPDAIAPFSVVICPLSADRTPAVAAAASALYEQLMANGVDVIWDDRGERPGVMFADWELIGVPHRITIGERGLNEGIVEYQSRRLSEGQKIPSAEIGDFILMQLKAAATCAASLQA